MAAWLSSCFGAITNGHVLNYMLFGPYLFTLAIFVYASSGKGKATLGLSTSHQPIP